MAVHQLKKELELTVGLKEAWDFLSNPYNLQKITPDYMGFEIRTAGLPEKVYPGLMISYWVRPFLGLKMNWLTEITHVREPHYFVDEQRAGPYALWHHEHHLTPSTNGVVMSDLISYKLPAGPLGDLAHSLFVKRQLEDIFHYRELALEKLKMT